jgi:2-C-methyl-D-erythritol 4-phosphate cytidylyltransferase
MSVAVVLVAAGSGQRLGAGLPKALVTLSGRPILDWALDAFLGHREIAQVVVVAPGGSVEGIASQLPPARIPVLVVAGGPSRSESVRRGLAALAGPIDYVLIHDAARPLVPARVISDVITALRNGADAVIPVLPVVDTIKRVDSTDTVTETIDRTELRRVQTPQGFRRSTLQAAYLAAPELTASDDAAIAEAHGDKVVAVPGDEDSFKITTPHDLRLAELLVANR